MKLSAIAAVAENYVIGRENSLPWRQRDDMRWFVKHTKNKPIISGRKTFESTGYLKNRRNIVLSRSTDWDDGADVVAHSIEAAMAACEDAEEAMVLGGAGVYEATEPLWDRLYLTVIHATPEGDTWFPTLDPNAWSIAFEEHRSADDNNDHPMTFYILDRVAPTVRTTATQRLPDQFVSVP